MSRKPATHRKDAIHDAVVAIAQEYGWQTVSLTSVGDGCPDLLCWRSPQGYRLIEIKTGKAGRLTPAQQRFKARYTMPVIYVRSVAEAQALFSTMWQYDDLPEDAARLLREHLWELYD